jgi:hypothetical protein
MGMGGPGQPHVPQVYSDWTLMMFANTGTPQVGAGNGTPSLGAIAPEAREAKVGAEKPEVKIKQDAEGHAVVVQREQRVCEICFSPKEFVATGCKWPRRKVKDAGWQPALRRTRGVRASAVPVEEDCGRRRPAGTPAVR